MKAAIRHHLARDTRLQPLLDSHPPPPLPSERSDLYQALLRSVIFQQLSTKAASTIYRRFLDLFDDPAIPPTELMAFPEERLRSVGLSRQKAKYVRHIAGFWSLPENRGTDWSNLSDEEILQRLTTIKGVGPWTAQMILMFSLGRPDVFPVLDQGLQQAIKLLYERPESGKALRQASVHIAEAWRPYRSFACRLLWHWYDSERGQGPG